MITSFARAGAIAVAVAVVIAIIGTNIAGITLIIKKLKTEERTGRPYMSNTVSSYKKVKAALMV